MKYDKQTFRRWQERRYWLYPDGLIDSASQFPPMDKEKWKKFLAQTEDISEEQIKCELKWDQMIFNMTQRGWKDSGKMYFESPHDKKKYDVRDALLIYQDMLEKKAYLNP